MPQSFVNKTELAARLGLTKGRITQLCKDGLPVRSDGKIDLDPALEWIATTREQRGGVHAGRGVNRVVEKLVDRRSSRYAPVADAATHEAITPTDPTPPDMSPAMAPSGCKSEHPATSPPGDSTVEEMFPKTRTPSYAESRALRESALAQLAQLKLETERGNVVEIEQVRRDWGNTLTDLRGRLLAIPPRVAAAAPHLTPTDVAIVAKELTQALQELSGVEMA